MDFNCNEFGLKLSHEKKHLIIKVSSYIQYVKTNDKNTVKSYI